MLQALKEEPPLHTKCKDKFLIQSTIITPDKEALPLHDLVSALFARFGITVFSLRIAVPF